MKIQDIILLILTLIAISVSIWYLIGDSPSFEQAILILIATMVFSNSTKISDINTRLNSLEKSFSHLAKDFKEHIRK